MGVSAKSVVLCDRTDSQRQWSPQRVPIGGKRSDVGCRLGHETQLDTDIMSETLGILHWHR